MFYNDFSKIENEILDLFVKDNAWFFKPTNESTGFPHYNAVVGKDENLVISFALAGYTGDSIKVMIDRGNLIVSHVGMNSYYGDDVTVIHKGIKDGGFEKVFKLSDKYQDSQPEASFYNGMLVIIVKPNEDKKSKIIPVTIK